MHGSKFGGDFLQFILDMHCHTLASSHAQSTLEENLVRAKEIGLKLVGISEHGPAMPDGCPLYHFKNMLKLPHTINGMPWLKGVEANIINKRGGLDIPANLLNALDYVIASIHTGVFNPGNAEANTNAIIGAMENPHVNIIGHLGDHNVPINVEPIVAAAKTTKTLIEINNSSLIPGTRRYDGGITIKEILAHCKKHNVAVIVGSDAHKARDVGRFKHAKALIKKSGIDSTLIVNTDIHHFINLL